MHMYFHVYPCCPQPAVVTPLHDPTLPNSLVMPRPTPQHQVLAVLHQHVVSVHDVSVHVVSVHAGQYMLYLYISIDVVSLCFVTTAGAQQWWSAGS